MASNPVISIIIVSWNAKNYLRECLDSLFCTGCGYPLEVIVIDNASTDGSPELVSATFPQVRLIRNQSNLGFAKANNVGIRISTGTYLCLVNSDVRILDGCIDKLAHLMETRPDVGIAGPRMLNSAGITGRSCRGFPTIWNMFSNAVGFDLLFPRIRFFGGYVLRYWPQNTNRSVDILAGWFWIVRRSALDQVGLLDEDFFFYAEDTDWCTRFKMNGWGVEFLADAASVHYGGGSSTNAPVKYYIQQQRADLQYWRKHHSRVSGWIYFCICIIYQGGRALAHGIIALLPSKGPSHRCSASRSWHCLIWYLKGAS